MTTTTTVGTNLGETMNFIITGNTNKGNTAPLFKIKTETEMEVATQAKIETPLGDGTVSTKVN